MAQYRSEEVEQYSVAEQPAGLGVGIFNPGGIQAESGFVPVLPSSDTTPGLAFSILEELGARTRGDVGMMARSDSEQWQLEGGAEAGVGAGAGLGDRGTVRVDIPAQVSPVLYPRTPHQLPSLQRSLHLPDQPHLLDQPADKNSADFHSFSRHIPTIVNSYKT